MIRSRQRPRVGGSGASGSLALRLDFMSSTSLDQRVTFSRGTNATMIDSTGQLTYAPSNQVLNSESFGNVTTWPRTTSNVTSNATVAPDGTTTADKLLVDGTAGALHYIASTISGQSGVNYTYSLYVKAAELSQVSILIPAALVGATTQVTFDTATNPASVIGTVGSPIWSNITAVGNGWYRVAMAVAATATVSGGAQIKLAKNGSNVFDGNSVDGLYIWGAQFGAMTYETAPRAYNSTTPKNLLGFTEEFNNAAWTKNNSYIQINLQTHSEQFDVVTSWTTAGVNNPTANSAIAPNGTLTADTVVPNATSTINHILSSTVTVTTGTQYTYSMYAKAAGYDFLYLRGLGFGTGGGAVFNVSTGEMVNKNSWSTASISSVGNGWYRCVVTGTALATTAPALIISNEPTYTVPFAGDGTSGIYLWGAQLVQGNTAGDYQQTIAAAAVVQYADPNGYLNAEKLVEDTATTEHFVDQPFTAISATTYTYSAYAKAGERNQIVLRFAVGTVFVGGSVQVGFTLTGSGSSFAISGSPTGSSITAVGNGWYRCSISVLTVAAVAATPSARVQLHDGTSANYTGNGTSGAYIWGAQLSDSASVDPYVYNPAAALTSTAYYGPRFDYDPVTLAPLGLLIEEARTNLLLQSEQLDVAATWPTNNVDVTANSVASPDGTTNADAIIERTTPTVFHYINQSVTKAASSIQYAASFYVKNKGREIVINIQSSGSNGVAARFDPATGNITSGLTAFGTGWTAGSFTVTFAGNGWYRVVTVATSDTTTTAQFQCSFYNTVLATNVYTGDGVSGVYFWGAQLEAGAFATSYIPTTSASVTRSADNAIMVGNNFTNWYNASEGAFVASASVLSTATNRGVYAASDGSNANEFFHYASTSANNQVTVASIPQANIFFSGVVSANTVFKDAFAYSVNNINAAFNGAIGTPDTSATIPTVNQLSLGVRGDGSFRLNGYIKSISYYNTRLPDAQLQEITA